MSVSLVDEDLGDAARVPYPPAWAAVWWLSDRLPGFVLGRHLFGFPIRHSPLSSLALCSKLESSVYQT